MPRRWRRFGRLRNAGQGEPEASVEGRHAYVWGGSKGGESAGGFSKNTSLRRKRTFRTGSLNTPPVDLGRMEGSMRECAILLTGPTECSKETLPATRATHLKIVAGEADSPDLLRNSLDTCSFLGQVPLRRWCGHDALAWTRWVRTAALEAPLSRHARRRTQASVHASVYGLARKNAVVSVEWGGLHVHIRREGQQQARTGICRCRSLKCPMKLLRPLCPNF